MYKLLFTGLLAVSSLAYAGSGTPKDKKGKAKTSAACAKACSSKPGCPLPGRK
ncbi:hypothetical protein IC235_19200 [Hymenobacter sp. BT664]|uniref:Uncharacterized protein n=1 Tax=Hymenobacter montanus TaxID=2771359 RepID=A0A927GL05_9BACT|nr:hypothetical protein [Hymenobacter montanus]MBD2770020.1 hypothetical protein [Hymenobacter montanus]